MNTPPRPSPAQRLRALHQEGRLAADWPAVASLLAEADDAAGRDRAGGLEELLACGGILAAVDPAEVLARHPAAPLATIALTGPAATARLTPPLTAELARHGILLRLVTGERGAHWRDLSDPGSQLAHARPDLTLCLLDAGAVFDELAAPWDVTDAELACTRLAARLQALAAAHAEREPGTLVLNTLPLLRRHTHQLLDETRRTQLSAIWRDFNAGLLRLAAACPQVTAVDLDPLIAETGAARDARAAPFTDALLAAYAREAGHLLRARRGLTKKCLVLDLDDPPGSGGPGGGAGHGPRKAASRAELQAVLRQLAAQGVLLATTTGSGQDGPAPAGDGLPARPHPAPREDGSAGVRGIAERLGLGVGDLVLAGPGERGRALPGVTVLPLGGDPALHAERLLQDSWFTASPPPLPLPPSPAKSEWEQPARRPGESARRASPRRAAERRAAERRAAEHRAGERRRCSYEEPPHDLAVHVTLATAPARDYARLARLSLHTDQFNLTGRRLSRRRLTELAAGSAHQTLAVRVRDRSGDDRLVGALVIRRAADGLHLETFLLSRRVLARGIEEGIVAALLAAAARRGLPAVHACYRATAANGRARALYPGLGFRARRPPSAAAAARGEQWFTHDLSAPPPPPAHLTLDLDLRLDDPQGPPPGRPPGGPGTG
ncbi:methoxymalonyl-ACP biosynthesis protein FkbH [Streptomyces sp. NPDC046465]|uniref:methoxymalonyl-ACP biosynthesis protein FkbH n=1 Tax=Streptomyces sp. NPDC046465 TaxID=3155810 RepID=UPI0033FA065B